jgi:hypothetical protein
MHSLHKDVSFIVGSMLPYRLAPIPFELRREILEFSGLLTVGRRSLVWVTYF